MYPAGIRFVIAASSCGGALPESMKPGETTADGKFTVKGVECLAACGGAPAVQVNGEWLEHATAGDIDRVIAGETVRRSFE